tara:strand:+ start:356 stop:517 length:162 start_codon:yes stop_codon:yes gene_type:complete
MKKILTSRNGFIHLYNPKKEGLGSYDVHYINASKNKNIIKNNQKKNSNERFAA